MSVNIIINNAIKRYGDNTVISNLSVDIKEGEFFTLLGPSGCGKTTLLRMIAGFNSIEGGDFYFNDARINDTEPSKRNIGMVFQNYAIFPHLSVYDNVAFGLKNRNFSKDQIEDKVNKVLETMQITEFKNRMPDKMSGGQQQRVALARAIVIEPDVLLMDEPLSNLDAKLRIDMRTAIREIQTEFGITTVYVTHDQEEAMSVSDRIAVMKDGQIMHIGTPQNIYHRPANQFVATFIGRSNLLEASLVMDEKVTLQFKGNKTIDFDKEHFLEDTLSQDVIVSIRPEEFEIVETGVLEGEVIRSEFLGLNTHYTVKLETGNTVDIVEESSLERVHNVGSTVFVNIKKQKINIFDKKGDINLVKGVINDNA